MSAISSQMSTITVFYSLSLKKQKSLIDRECECWSAQRARYWKRPAIHNVVGFIVYQEEYLQDSYVGVLCRDCISSQDDTQYLLMILEETTLLSSPRIDSDPGEP